MSLPLVGAANPEASRSGGPVQKHRKVAEGMFGSSLKYGKPETSHFSPYLQPNSNQG
jgi:hypothetical protein